MTPEQLQALLDYLDIKEDIAVMEAKGHATSPLTRRAAIEAVWEAFGLEPPR